MKKQFYNILLLSFLVTGTTYSDVLTITREFPDGSTEVNQQIANQSPSILCGLGMSVAFGLGWYAQHNYITPAFTKFRQGMWGVSVTDPEYKELRSLDKEILTTEVTSQKVQSEQATYCCLAGNQEKAMLGAKKVKKESTRQVLSEEHKQLIGEEDKKLWISSENKSIIANTFTGGLGVLTFLWLKNHPF